VAVFLIAAVVMLAVGCASPGRTSDVRRDDGQVDVDMVGTLVVIETENYTYGCLMDVTYTSL